MMHNLEAECDNKIHFLDLTLYRIDNSTELGIFHKLTQTDIIIIYYTQLDDKPLLRS
jgi:hypothetical protein